MARANTTQRISQREMEAYALGYYDGRCHGHEKNLPEDMGFTLKHYYEQGYESGVTDYCRFDIED